MGVTLTKGQQVSLSKSGGGALSVVRMGLGWQAAPRRGFLAKLLRPQEIDLDASAVLFADRKPVDVVYFQHLVQQRRLRTATPATTWSAARARAATTNPSSSTWRASPRTSTRSSSP